MDLGFFGHTNRNQKFCDTPISFSSYSLKRKILTVWKGRFWQLGKENFLTVWKGTFWQFVATHSLGITGLILIKNPFEIYWFPINSKLSPLVLSIWTSTINHNYPSSRRQSKNHQKSKWKKYTWLFLASFNQKKKFTNK
jgi:hypothetical protein